MESLFGQDNFLSRTIGKETNTEWLSENMSSFVPMVTIEAILIRPRSGVAWFTPMYFAYETGGEGLLRTNDAKARIAKPAESSGSSIRKEQFMGELSIYHWIVVLIVVILLFGGRKIPELMRGIGGGIRTFREGMDGTVTEREVEKTPRDKAEGTNYQ